MEGHKQGDSICRLVPNVRKAGMLEKGDVDDDAMLVLMLWMTVRSRKQFNHSRPPASPSEVTGIQNKEYKNMEYKNHGKFSTVTDWMRGGGSKKENWTPAFGEVNLWQKHQKKEGSNKVATDNVKNKHLQMDAT